jgi:hypothetical protein
MVRPFQKSEIKHIMLIYTGRMETVVFQGDSRG